MQRVAAVTPFPPALAFVGIDTGLRQCSHSLQPSSSASCCARVTPHPRASLLENFRVQNLRLVVVGQMGMVRGFLWISSSVDRILGISTLAGCFQVGGFCQLYRVARAINPNPMVSDSVE